MGAFDTYRCETRCPSCGDRYWMDGQTKFFVPDFGGLSCRDFARGASRPLDFSLAELLTAKLWDGEWFRVRDEPEPGRLELLADFDELHRCGCGLAFAIVLRFLVVPGEGESGTATLESITLLDALGDELADAVDFASAEFLVRSEGRGARAFLEAAMALAHAPADERAARLHEGLVRHFVPRGTEVARGSDLRWTELVGPMRCVACGDVRERGLMTLLSHPDYPESFFGPAWRGGVLGPGAMVEGELGWLESDVDRGYFLRLRHPLPTARLAVLHRPMSWGCPCGVGPAAVLARFAIAESGFVLESLELRVIRGREDLVDLDFVEAPRCTRVLPVHTPRQWVPSTREEAIAALLADWRVPAETSGNTTDVP